MQGLHPAPPPVPDDAPEETWPEDFDWLSWYQSQEEDVGQSGEQGDWIYVLMSALKQWALRQGWVQAHVNSDCFFAWDVHDPRLFVSPDVFLVDSAPLPLPRSFQTWLPGHHPPRVAFEFVSEDWKKDYYNSPADYDLLGVQELVVFDPGAARQMTLAGLGERDQPTRQALQLYTRDATGALTRTYAGQGPRWSEALGVYLTLIATELGPRLRLATDPQGLQRVPTAEEAADTARADAEAAELDRQTAQATADAAELDRQAARQRAEEAEEKGETARARAEAAELDRKAEHARAEAAEKAADAQHARADAAVKTAEAERERAEFERERADAAELKAELEQERAEHERHRAEAAELDREAARASAEREQERAEREQERAEAAELDREAARARAEREQERAEAAEMDREAERARAEAAELDREAARASAEREQERAEAAEMDREAARARAELERQRAEAETERADALARELAELRAQLAASTDRR